MLRVTVLAFPHFCLWTGIRNGWHQQALGQEPVLDGHKAEEGGLYQHMMPGVIICSPFGQEGLAVVSATEAKFARQHSYSSATEITYTGLHDLFSRE